MTAETNEWPIRLSRKVSECHSALAAKGQSLAEGRLAFEGVIAVNGARGGLPPYGLRHIELLHIC